MKVIIFGADGNLGTQLVKVFGADPENKVIAWDNTEIDVLDAGLVAKKVSELSPNLIINAAAYNAVDKCEEDEDEYKLAQAYNVTAVANLAEVALTVGATIMHFSSDYVFDGQSVEPYTEEAECRPLNKYGETKRGGELEVISRSGKGLKWYLIRTSKLFGPRGNSPFSKPSFFEVMMKLGRERESVDVVDSELSCFTYTPDLAEAVMDLYADDAGYGIYHLVNPPALTWYGGVCKLYAKCDIQALVRPVSPDEFPRPARRPNNSVLANTKRQPLRSLDDAIDDYLKNI